LLSSVAHSPASRPHTQPIPLVTSYHLLPVAYKNSAVFLICTLHLPYHSSFTKSIPVITILPFIFTFLLTIDTPFYPTCSTFTSYYITDGIAGNSTLLPHMRYFWVTFDDSPWLYQIYFRDFSLILNTFYDILLDQYRRHYLYNPIFFTPFKS
jgi:hypothetical protein